MEELTKTNEISIHQNNRFETVKVSYANGHGNIVLTHTIIKSRPSVAVVARKDKQIALITQFRSTTGQHYIEVPAGIINDGECEVEAAIRETLEETGLLVKDAYSLVKGPSLLDPSKSNENYGVVVADVYGQKAQVLDKMEQIDSEILWMDEEEVFSRVMAQMFKGKPFIDNLFMSGHSLYAVIAYKLSK